MPLSKQKRPPSRELLLSTHVSKENYLEDEGEQECFSLE